MTLPTAAEKARYVERMFDRVAPRYDLMNRLMTLGIDRGWRRAAVAALQLRCGDSVVDLGCGTGDLCAEAAGYGAEPVGVDFSGGMLMLAAEQVAGLCLLRADAAALPLPEASVDAVMSGFALRNFDCVNDVLGECGRVLRDGGRIALLEVDVPEQWLFRAGFDFYFHRVMPLLGRAVAGSSAYRYLSESIVYLPSEQQLSQGLEAAGFVEVCKRRFCAGAAQLVTAVRRRPAPGAPR